MAPVNCIDAPRASVTQLPDESCDSDAFELNDFEEELKRLADANQALLHDFNHDDIRDDDTPFETPHADSSELESLRRENAELRSHVQELKSIAATPADEHWQERQREYEMLLEEKSEVIRNLHLQMQEMQESALGGPTPPTNVVASSSVRLGQAEEILRLKREMDDQRRQLEQDEADMMTQMRQMEITMAKERAEMARQRQDVQRLQADLAREIEQSSRDPELRERLHNLRRSQEPKISSAPPLTTDKPMQDKDQKSSGFFRRIFG